MDTTSERFIEELGDASRAWYLTLARFAGAVLTLPVLRRLLPLSRRLEAIARDSNRVTVTEPPLPVPAPVRRLTVLSANLWHDWPRHRRSGERLEAFAKLVEAEEADIVLLQEVARTATMDADRWLAERLGLATIYARANGDLSAIGFEEGLAILSRFPLDDIHLHRLSRGRNPFARRIALGAHLRTPYGSLLVVSVHLGLVQRHNADQIRRLRDWVRTISGDEVAVVGGDFNAPERRSEIARTRDEWTDTFRHTNPHGDAITHTTFRPWRGPLHRRLDYIFVQQPISAPWDVLETAHVDAPAGPHSDHRAILTRLSPKSAV